MKVVISNIKSITQKHSKKIIFFYKAISSNKEKAKIILKEYPKQKLIEEISFELDGDLDYVQNLIIDFLSFIQGIKFNKTKEEWYTLKVGTFLITFYDKERRNIKIILK